MEESLIRRRVTVMGLGTFGAGVAAAQFFAERGADVTITDLRTSADLSDSVAALRSHTVTFHLGGHREEDFSRADIVVVSPAVKPGNRFVAIAAESGAELTSELRLFWSRCAAPIIGVTGTNGKSTTATLIRDMLHADGRRVWLGGNIGESLLPDVGDITRDDWVVLELSSFQLADLDTARLSPHVAVITNITPNHLDWHGTIEDYVSTKETIVRWQRSGDMVVRMPGMRESSWDTPATSWWFGWGDDGRCAACMTDDRSAVIVSGSETLIDFARCPGLPFTHARYNAVTAAATAVSLNVSPTAIRTALESFTGLPHRLQHVRDWRGRAFINDSASTTPESTTSACAAFPDQNVLLICGGREKGSDLAALADSLCRLTVRAYVIGDVAASLAQRTRYSQEGHPCQMESITVSDGLEAAVSAAVKDSLEGDVILFSPGFASGDAFRNYADRGEAFMQMVRDLP